MALAANALLQITARKHDVSLDLQHCTLQKNSLSRDMIRVSQKYQEALNSKVYKWSNNAGASYVDLSYSTLMKPGVSNKNKPYLLTNSSGKVVLDSKYEKYAEMISPDGKAGGDWTSNRTKILSQLTGLSEDKINNAVTTSAAVTTAADNVNALKEEVDKLEAKEPVNTNNVTQFLSKAGSVNVNNTSYDIAKLYGSSSTWTNLGNAATAKSALTNILNSFAQNMKDYLTDDDYNALTDACKTYMDANGHYFGGTSEADKQGLEAGTVGIKKSGDNYTVNLKTVLDSVLSSYENDTNSKQSNSGNMVYYTRDKNSTAWQDWNTKYQELQTKLSTANSEYKTAVDTDNQAMTSDEESSIQFYDQLFSAIASQGWVSDFMVEDNDYLNNMLQNNQYYITTMEDTTDSEGKAITDYNQRLASDLDNIVSVNDSAYQQEALVEYEKEKANINDKESRIDVRMQNLETELSALNNMLKGEEQIRDDNFDRTMNIFG